MTSKLDWYVCHVTSGYNVIGRGYSFLRCFVEKFLQHSRIPLLTSDPVTANCSLLYPTITGSSCNVNSNKK